MPPGFLLYHQEGTLLIQPFDAENLKATGEPTSLAENLISSSVFAEFSASTTGILAYRTGIRYAPTELAWYDRGGKRVAQVAESGGWINPELSPDGSRLAVEDYWGALRGDIWILDLARGTRSRFTFDAAKENTPLWAPNGTHIAYVSAIRGVGSGIYLKAADGLGKEILIRKADKSTTAPWLDAWSRDGKGLVYSFIPGEGSRMVEFVPISGNEGGDSRSASIVNPRSRQGQFSPDGRWFAYVDNNTGRSEIYVEEFPARGSKWQVSTNGGVQPRWRSDGKELFFVSSDRRLMAVPIVAEATFQAGVPQELFLTPAYRGFIADRYIHHQYAVAADGQRFLINAEVANASSPITVVTNFLSFLNK